MTTKAALMNSTHPSNRNRITAGTVLRMFADAGLVAAGLALAVVVRLVVLIVFEKPDGAESFFYVRRDAISFLQAFGPLTSIVLIVFWLGGFYTYGKNYLSKYKPVIVAQATTLGFLIFGFLAYFISGGELPIARGAFYLAWIFATCLLAGARVWTDLWKGFVEPERQKVIRHNQQENRVLVIGGAGYIGSALIPMLLERGFKVRILDILLFGDEPIREVIDHENLEIVRGDFRNVVSLFQALQDVSAVVHLGAIVGDPACDLDEQLTLDVNLVSTRVITELARTAGVQRFVFASTCSVYGASNELLDESSEVRPISLYGNTKLASERVVLGAADGGFAPTILRFGTIYGFSGRTRFDLVVNLLTAKARLEGEITIHGGNQWRPFVHVRDAAKAVLGVLVAPVDEVREETFNVGSDEQNYTIQQVGEIIQERVLDSHLVVSDTVTDQRNYRVSFQKIRQQLGFTPDWTLEDGIQQVLEAIANGQVNDYRDAQYSNAKYLTGEGASKLNYDQWARDLIQDVSGK